MKRFLVCYRHDGGQWNIELPAESLEDAHRRLGQLTFGRIEGEIVAKVPGGFGFIAAIAAAARNSFAAIR